MQKIPHSLTVLTLLGVLVTSSCKKTDTTPNGGGGAAGLLKTETMVFTANGKVDTTTTTLTYDNQNRIITQIGVTDVGGALLGSDTTTYTYSANTVVQYSSGIGSITYTLNSQGFKASDNLGDSWTYNSGGYMIQAVEAAAGSTTTYTYNSLNQLAMETSVRAGDTSTYTFTYPGNPIGKAGSSWNTGESTGDLFTTDVEDQIGVITTLNATYVLNAQGMLGESIITSSTPGSSPIDTYFTYY